MSKMELIAPCMFGLESFVADEVRRLGYETISVTDGRICFAGDESAIARCNIGLRCAERVLIKIAEFKALTFDELFEGVKAIDWTQYIAKEEAFPVTGHSLKSKLASIPDCQKIIKKAIVESLKSRYRVEWFSEIGTTKPISFLLMKDTVAIMLDTTGDGLHKRGYRKTANLAPLRETLASAMVKTTRVNSRIPFWDPFAGSGTIVIEAAQIIANIAPGLKRRFIGEKFDFVGEKVFAEARAEAMDKIRPDKFKLAATDIDPEMKPLGEHNAKLAGVDQFIKFGTMDVAKMQTATERGIVCCNPPYGERMLEREEAEKLYRVMGEAFTALPNWKYYIISSHEEFEKYFGKRADKKRKLYNGMIKCDYYQYFK